jgi:hypothetical protein
LKEFITTDPAFNSAEYRGSGGKTISLLERILNDPLPLIENAAELMSPVFSVSPGKMVKSVGAGTPFIVTGPTVVTDPTA